jgi:hypothetical protein
VIFVDGAFSIETAATVIADADPQRPLDLRRCRFVDPVGMVALAVAAQAWGASHLGRWRMPNDQGVCSYLARMRVPRVLHDLGRLVPDREVVVREHDQQGYLCELTHAASGEPARVLGGLVLDRLDPTTPQQVSEAVWACIVETWQNILQHAEAPVGFAAAQVLGRGTSRERIVIGIADAGVGVASSLARVLGPTRDEEAIRAAIEGTTATGDIGRGRGLATVRQLAAGELGGRLLVHSRAGFVTAVGAGLEARATPSRLPGTIIGMEIPCSTT